MHTHASVKLKSSCTVYLYITDYTRTLGRTTPRCCNICKIGKNSVEIQVDIPPITRDAQTQVAPETRHIAIGRQSTTYIYMDIYSVHGAEAQATPTVSHIGIQCELLLPPSLTSTPKKASVGASKPVLSDISEVDDITNDEGGTAADTTQSTLYEETTSASEPESDLSVEKQQTEAVQLCGLSIGLTIARSQVRCSAPSVAVAVVSLSKELYSHCSSKPSCING